MHSKNLSKITPGFKTGWALFILITGWLLQSCSGPLPSNNPDIKYSKSKWEVNQNRPPGYFADWVGGRLSLIAGNTSWFDLIPNGPVLIEPPAPPPVPLVEEPEPGESFEVSPKPVAPPGNH